MSRVLQPVSIRRAPPQIAATGAPRSLNVHIEELVLHGFARSDRRRIAVAMQQELSRLVAGHGSRSMHQSIGSESMTAGPIRVAVGATPPAMGRQIARTLFSNLNRQKAVASAGRGGSRT